MKNRFAARRWMMGAAGGGRIRRVDVRALLRDEPVSRLSIWSRRSALFGLTLAVIATGLIRLRAVDVPGGLAILAAAFLFATAALPLALAALIVIWRTGRRGIRVALFSCLLAALMTAYPASLALRATNLPLVNDISTDVADPPAFSRASSAFAGRDGHLPGHGRRPTAEAQTRSYPDARPIVVDMDTYDVYQLIARVAGELHWSIVYQAPPGGREGIGHVDAVDRTLVLGLPDDVTIRIRPLGDGSRIDMRSASRYGFFDFGTNAARIRRFAQAVEDQIAPK